MFAVEPVDTGNAAFGTFANGKHGIVLCVAGDSRQHSIIPSTARGPYGRSAPRAGQAFHSAARMCNFPQLAHCPGSNGDGKKEGNATGRGRGASDSWEC